MSDLAATQPRQDDAAEEGSFNWLALILYIGVSVRLGLALLPGHSYDIGTFGFWAHDLARNGSLDFFDKGPDQGIRDYFPGYLYILWALGLLSQATNMTRDTFEFFLKLPPIAADSASALLLHALLRGKVPERTRLFAVAGYLALPPVLFIGALWGQADSLLAFGLLGAIYFLDRNRPVAAAVAFTVAFIIKPQAIAALPVFMLWGFRHHSPRQWLEAAGASLAAGLVLILPFFPNPLDIVGHAQDITDLYKLNALTTFNFWSLWGWKVSDTQTFLGVTWHTWGFVLTGVAYVPVLLYTRRADDAGSLALAVALALIVFFTFQTRMHERYLFPAVLPLWLACIMLRSWPLWGIFAAVNVTLFASLWEGYFAEKPDTPFARFVSYAYDAPEIGANWIMVLLSVVMLWTVAAALAYVLRLWYDGRASPAVEQPPA